jgi:hypothetical protein
MDKIEFAGLTDDALAALSTADLRELAEDHLDRWSNGRSEIVKEFKITKELLTTPGVLTALEKMIQLIMGAYADRGPDVTHDYGSVSLTVWDTDDMLRRRLRTKRDEVAKEVAAETE